MGAATKSTRITKRALRPICDILTIPSSFQWGINVVVRQETQRSVLTNLQYQIGIRMSINLFITEASVDILEMVQDHCEYFFHFHDENY